MTYMYKWNLFVLTSIAFVFARKVNSFIHRTFRIPFHPKNARTSWYYVDASYGGVLHHQPRGGGLESKVVLYYYYYWSPLLRWGANWIDKKYSQSAMHFLLHQRRDCLVMYGYGLLRQGCDFRQFRSQADRKYCTFLQCYSSVSQPARDTATTSKYPYHMVGGYVYAPRLIRARERGFMNGWQAWISLNIASRSQYTDSIKEGGVFCQSKRKQTRSLRSSFDLIWWFDELSI